MAELSEQKQQTKAMWALGDYGAVVHWISSAGEAAAEAAAIGPDDEVLDVACGTGNATIPAARTGATVTGLDLTPELLEGGRAAAADAGVEIDWVEGDAEALPFDDDSFDAVISVFGAMFAPDQRRAASEIARVLRPGGRMAVNSWAPEGSIGRFFALIGTHMPPPPDGFQPPILWGEADHVRSLFEGTGVELEFEERAVHFEGDSVEEFFAVYEDKLPPMVAAKAMLEPEGKWPALRDDLLALYEDVNLAEDGTYSSKGEYLVARGRKA